MYVQGEVTKSEKQTAENHNVGIFDLCRIPLTSNSVAKTPVVKITALSIVEPKYRNNSSPPKLLRIIYGANFKAELDK